jgi:hypothetical protein
MSHDVFVSYSSRDKAAADAVCARLEAAKIRCWIAPRDIMPGADWGCSIIDAIAGCRAMVLVFSANANTSPQVKREVERAVHHGVPLIPFRIENVMPEKSLEYFLSSPHWLDAYTPPLDRHLAYLVNILQQVLSGDAPGPAQNPLQMPPPRVPPAFAWEAAKPPRRWGWGTKLGVWSLAVIVALGLIGAVSNALKPVPTQQAATVDPAGRAPIAAAAPPEAAPLQAAPLQATPPAAASAAPASPAPMGPLSPAPGPMANVYAGRWVGSAHNDTTNSNGTLTLIIETDPATGRVRAQFETVGQLSGSGQLDGNVVANGAIVMTGAIISAGNRVSLRFAAGLSAGLLVGLADSTNMYGVNTRTRFTLSRADDSETVSAAPAPEVQHVVTTRYLGTAHNDTYNANGSVALEVTRDLAAGTARSRFRACCGLTGSGELEGTISPDGELDQSGQISVGMTSMRMDLRGHLSGSRLSGDADIVALNGARQHDRFVLRQTK